MPQALGSRYFLPSASCETCRKITHAFETRVLNSAMFAPLRKQFGLRAKRRPIHPHQEFRVDLTNDGKDTVPHRFKMGDVPLSAFMPEFPSPGMLQKGSDPDSYRHSTFQLHVYGRTDHNEVLRELGFNGIAIALPLHDLARMLAKVAHCMAIATFGPDKFESVVIPIIIDGSPSWPYFVGGFTDAFKKPETPPHTFGLIGDLNTGIGSNISIAHIKLFSHTPIMPRYKVMTGRFVGGIEECLSYRLEPGQYGRRRPVPAK